MAGYPPILYLPIFLDGLARFAYKHHDIEHVMVLVELHRQNSKVREVREVQTLVPKYSGEV